LQKSVLITGAGSGIGLATALYLAERGMHVYATAPFPDQQEAILAAADDYGVRLRVLPLDVTEPESIEAAIHTMAEEAGAIYSVVNSAGLGMRGFFEDISEEEMRRLFDVNVFGVMAVTRAVLPHMRGNRQGRIVIISSAGGRIATMSLSVYCAGKFALEGFGESLAMEVAPFGIYVSLIEPGIVMTPHFTEHRGRAQKSADPSSPYYAWFARHEQMVDGILRSGRIKPVDVAETIHQSLVASRPRLRYVVGKGAKIMIWLRRYLPSSWFESLYFRAIIRRTTDPSRPVPRLENLAMPGQGAIDYLGLPMEKKRSK
jgi:NAD(P)-dependent dehydrogenase (short-subunit alcohol dehydrogenase family)